MNYQVPVAWVLLVFGGCVVVYVFYRWWRALEKSTRRICESSEAMVTALASATTALNQARDGLLPAADEIRANMAAVPKLLEAVAKIGHAQLEAFERQRAAEAEAKKNPFGKTNGPAAPKDVEAANLEYEVSQLMRSEGISREEAMLRMNPANMRSAWGDNLFEGWR